MFKNEQLYVPYRCLRYFYIRSEKPPEASYLQERRCRIFTEISYANQGPPSRLGKETTCVIPPTHFCSNSRFSQKYRKDAKLCIPRSWIANIRKKLTTSEDEIGMMNEFAEIQDAALFLRREKTKSRKNGKLLHFFCCNCPHFQTFWPSSKYPLEQRMQFKAIRQADKMWANFKVLFLLISLYQVIQATAIYNQEDA